MAFPPNLRAPAKIQLAKLESWTASADDGVKYFSGTATYTKTLQAPPTWFRPGAKVLLDLGAVKDLVDVSVNGKPLATLWKPPYQVDVTGVLKPGPNQLEFRVTNEWSNRQPGDRLGPPEKRVLAAPAGMLGGRSAPPQAAHAGAAPAAGRGGAPPVQAQGGGAGGAFGGRGPQTPAESGLLGPVTVLSVAAAR